MHSVEDFIKLASPYLDYIENSQRYLDAVADEPYNKYFQEGMDKEAMSVLRPLGHAAMSTLHGMVTHPIGGTLRTLGKWMIKRPQLSRNGKRIIDAGNLDKWTGKLGMRLAGAGAKMQRAAKHADIRLLNDLGYKTGQAAENLGFWGRQGNRLKRAVPFSLTTGGFLAGAAGVPGFEQAMNAGWYLTPLGAGVEGVSWAGDKVMQGIGSIKEKAMQGAESAAMATAQEIANGIYNQGRMGHMYGVWSPEGFRDRLLEQAQQGIKDRFTQLRGGELA